MCTTDERSDEWLCEYVEMDDPMMPYDVIILEVAWIPRELMLWTLQQRWHGDRPRQGGKHNAQRNEEVL